MNRTEERGLRTEVSGAEAQSRNQAPFYSGGRYLREQFPFRVFKIAINAGFTCPNRDGTSGEGGCTYCCNASFNPNSRGASAPIAQQIADGMRFYRDKLQGEKFIIYFQAYTNTYGPRERLRQLYDGALNFPDVVGLSIGTRPDCVPDLVLDLLAEYARRTHLWLELGFESSHNVTLRGLNRGHTYGQFVDAVRRAHERALKVCAHVILGLPGETHAMMLETADRLAQLRAEGLKLHHLYVAKGSRLEHQYGCGDVRLLSLREYVELACDFLERTPPDVVVQRLTGEVAEPYVVAPHWGVTKLQVIHLISEEFRRRGSRQGSSVSEMRNEKL